VKTFNDITNNAPAIPGPTCTYIDHIMRVLTEEVKPLISDKNKQMYIHVLTNVKAELEYVREANGLLPFPEPVLYIGKFAR
jgi:hypothetical protein